MLDVIEVFYKKILAPENCFSIREIAKTFSLKKVLDAADACIRDHFQSLSKNYRFCHLEAKEVEQLISSDELRVRIVCKICT